MLWEKLETFILDLSFIGWILLTVITCGLAGIFYVQPYYEATITELYVYNKIKAYHEGYILQFYISDTVSFVCRN